MFGLLLALGMGLAAGALVMRQSAGPPEPKVTKEKTIKVVVMARKLSRGLKLAKKDITLKEWPERLATPQLIRNLKQAEGRIIISDLVAGEPLLLAKLAPPDSVVGLSTLIPLGRRAFTIRVTEVTGVSGFLLPGSRVDVHATFDVEAGPKEAGKKVSVTKTVLQNVEVLAAGGEKDVGKKKKGRISTSVVTLLLTPAQSDKMAMVNNAGSIWLSMRNPRDKKLAPAKALFVSDLAQIKKPAKAKDEKKKTVKKKGKAVKKKVKAVKKKKPPPHVVEIIRGGEKTTTEF